MFGVDGLFQVRLGALCLNPLSFGLAMKGRTLGWKRNRKTVIPREIIAWLVNEIFFYVVELAIWGNFIREDNASGDRIFISRTRKGVHITEVLVVETAWTYPIAFLRKSLSGKIFLFYCTWTCKKSFMAVVLLFASLIRRYNKNRRGNPYNITYFRL